MELGYVEFGLSWVGLVLDVFVLVYHILRDFAKN